MSKTVADLSGGAAISGLLQDNTSPPTWQQPCDGHSSTSVTTCSCTLHPAPFLPSQHAHPLLEHYVDRNAGLGEPVQIGLQRWSDDTFLLQ